MIAHLQAGPPGRVSVLPGQRFLGRCAVPPLMVLVAVAVVLVVGHGARAADDDDLLVPLVPPPGLARWGAVPAWKGTFRAVWHERQVQNHGNGGEANEDQIVDGTVFLDQQTNLGHTAKTDSGGQRASIWHGWAKASIRIQKLDIQKSKNGQVFRRDEASGEGLAGADCDLQIDAVRGTFILHVRQLRIDMQYKNWQSGSPPVSSSSVGTNSVELSAASMHGSHGLGSGILPASGLELSQTAPYDYTSNDGRVSTGTYSYSLHPVGELPKVELVVDSTAYDAWRPEAGPDEKTIGNEIKFESKLQNPDGSEAKAKAVKILFELIDSSREPGIAMNFPVTGAGKDCDLQFSPKSNPPDQYILSGTGNQRAETVPGEYTAAAATVSSYDWGGWSTLRVSAELKDGRHVPGHFRTKSGPTDILLPKRAARSNIAESWRHDVGVALSLPDNDDSDPGPAGNNNQGDGFTLYEEYRGFYVNGKHLAGDPKKIDFFVRNYIRADAEAGIALFADLTGAEVHAPLLDTEFDRKKRVMNGNHSQGAHRVDQHGVFLQTQAGLDGGLTVLSKKGVRGRPVIVLGVDLQPHNSLTGMTTSENVPISDLARAYDRAVAHELLHTVGAEHHGEGDGVAEFYFHFGDDPQNATGKAYFSFESGPASKTYLGFTKLPGVGDAKTIIDEASGRDLAGLMEGDMMLERESMRPIWYPLMLDGARRILASPHSADYPWTAEQLAETKLNELVAGAGKSWYVGAEHGESSGNELCVMRYYFAKLYEKRGTANAFYYIRDRRSEHAGRELCRSPAGTGINAKERPRQPRYGDAAATRGACALSLIFNDALPLKPDAIPPPPKPKP